MLARRRWTASALGAEAHRLLEAVGRGSDEGGDRLDRDPECDREGDGGDVADEPLAVPEQQGRDEQTDRNLDQVEDAGRVPGPKLAERDALGDERRSEEAHGERPAVALP